MSEQDLYYIVGQLVVQSNLRILEQQREIAKLQALIPPPVPPDKLDQTKAKTKR